MFSFNAKSGAFAGKTVYTNTYGEGVFTDDIDQFGINRGKYLQHTGTGQTPKFRSVKHFSKWVHKHFDF